MMRWRPDKKTMTDTQLEAHDQRRIDRSLVSGIAWTALLRWLAQVVSWAGTLVAARILAPADYGLIAMAMLPIGLVRMVEDFGLDAVLVQDRTIDGTGQAKLAGFALLLGGALAAIFFAAAPLFANFFKEPSVAIAIQWLCLLLIFDSLQIVPRALLQRELAFRRLAFLTLVQVVATQAALVGAAMSGFGYLSLVFNSLAGGAAVTILLLWWKPYPVRFPHGIRTIAGPIFQGWRLLMSRAAWYAYSNADQTVIGRVIGKEALGAYSFATTFAYLPTQEISPIVSKVVPGVFAEVQNDKPRLRRYFLMLTEFTTLLTFPAAVGLALIADVLVALALGPKWSAVTGPMRILCIAVTFNAAQMLISHVLLWTGRFRANMWCSILAAATLPIAFLIGARYGLEGVAWAWAVALPIVNMPAIVIAFRVMQLEVRPALAALMPASVACVFMTIGVLLAREVVPQYLPNYIRFGALVSVGFVTYVAALWLLYRRRVLALWSVVRGRAEGA
jgi:teichuronic acid exporter